MNRRFAQQPWRILARAIWVVLYLVLAVVVANGTLARDAQLRRVTPAADMTVGQLTPADVEGLAGLGWSVEQYVRYFTVAELLPILLGMALGALIFWRRGDDWFAWFVSLALPYYLAFNLPIGTVLGALGGVWEVLNQVGRALSLFGLVIFSFAFPDGRFIPRWARWTLVVWVLYTLVWLINPAFAPPRGMAAVTLLPQFLVIGWLLAWMLLGAFAQIYRYRVVSNAAQRQQTKWAVFGFAGLGVCAVVGTALVFASTASGPTGAGLFYRVVGATILLIGTALVPLSLALAILRSHLWEIDVIIRRTVTYAFVVALLALVYFGSVILLQRVFAGIVGGNSEIVTVLSTLAIAALFIPLRNRIQGAIDKRFYRRKYDAQKVLQKFSETVRDETDIDKLTAELVNVVQETMQPKSISLWLKRDDRK